MHHLRSSQIQILLIKISYNMAKQFFWPNTIQIVHYTTGQRRLLECVTLRKSSRKCHEMKLNFNDGVDPHTSLVSMGATFPHRSLVEIDHAIQTVRCCN